MKHSVYSEILASMGWFDTGMDKPEPFFSDYRLMHPRVFGDDAIMPSTLIAYYPGCFAEFHMGHMAVYNAGVPVILCQQCCGQRLDFQWVFGIFVP